MTGIQRPQRWMDRRRWVVRPRPRSGDRDRVPFSTDSATSATPCVVVTVLDEGAVLVSATAPVRFPPRQVERVREALAEARAVSLWISGDW